METILAAIVKALASYGPAGIIAAVGLLGWGAAAWLVRRQLKRKDQITEKTASFAAEVHKVHEKYASEIGKLNEKHNKKIEELNEKHSATVAELNEERFRDLKANADDYHDLAQNMLQALDRLSIQFQISRGPATRGDSDEQ